MKQKYRTYLQVLLFDFTGRPCPNITVANSNDTYNLPGVYETYYTVECLPGYVITGDVTSYYTECLGDKTWSHVEDCFSKYSGEYHSGVDLTI